MLIYDIYYKILIHTDISIIKNCIYLSKQFNNIIYTKNFWLDKFTINNIPITKDDFVLKEWVHVYERYDSARRHTLSVMEKLKKEGNSEKIYLGLKAEEIIPIDIYTNLIAIKLPEIKLSTIIKLIYITKDKKGINIFIANNNKIPCIKLYQNDLPYLEKLLLHIHYTLLLHIHYTLL